MPGKDGTGPLGMGPGSGRGYGPCAGNPVPPYAGYGRGAGCRRGRRMMVSGMMHYGYPITSVSAAPNQSTATPATQETATEIQLAQEKAALETQVKNLENQLEQETAALIDQIKIMTDQLEQVKEQLKNYEA